MRRINAFLLVVGFLFSFYHASLPNIRTLASENLITIEETAAPLGSIEPLFFYGSEPSEDNPCFMWGDYYHMRLDENWVCERCGEYVGPRYGFTGDEVYLLAQMLCGDQSVNGDGEYDFVWSALYSDEIRYDQISLVLCVVMNRVRSEQYPDNVTDVLLQEGQFAVFPANLDTTPHAVAIEKVQEWCDAYDRWDLGVQNIPKDHLYFSAGPNLTNISRSNF